MVPRAIQTFDGLRLSTEDWPVILLEFPEKLLRDEGLHEALMRLEQLFEQAKYGREKTFTVTDLTRMHQLSSAKQRKWVGDWMSRTLDLQKAASVGGANVTPSTILRGLITAVYWFAPPPLPSVFVATRREAYAAALKAFAAARIALPADLKASLATRI